MLQTTSQQIISSTKTRLKINITKPPQRTSKVNPSPIFARKRQMLSKSNKSSKQRNSSQQKSMQRSLRFHPIMPTSPKSAISVVQSQVHEINLVTAKMQDSKKTVHRDRSISKNSQHFLKVKEKDSSQSKKGVNGSRREKSKSPWMDKKDQNYIYWKNKAHQYLELNIKLMNDVRRLTKENQHINNLLQQTTQSLAIKQHCDSSQRYNQATLSQQIRNISSIYINKIQGIEKKLKRKDMIIAGYELRIKDMSIKLTGDNQRVKLIGKLEQEIERLKDEVFTFKGIDNLKINSRLNESTELFGYDYDHH